MTETQKNGETLKTRAESMAAPAEEKSGAGADYLEFGAAGEHYAVELPFVREVCSGREITRIPGAPPFITGVANIRGRILPVMDLALFFGALAESPKRRELVILSEDAADARGEHRELGILADAIAGVRHLPAAEIQPPPAGFRGVYAQYLGGITAQGLIIFLADKFLGASYAQPRQAGAEASGRAGIDSGPFEQLGQKLRPLAEQDKL